MARMRRIGAAILVSALAGFAVARSATPDSAPGKDAAPSQRSAPFYATPFERTPTFAELASLGRELFFDRALSASGTLACASCHDPQHAYGPPNARSVQTGGAGDRTPGLRSAPSLRYLQAVPPFTEHFHDSEGDDSVDQGPAGGRTWDGRAHSAHDQARLPLLASREMANGTPAAVVERMRRRPYADRIRATFGPHVLDDEALAFNAVLLALEVFQQTPQEFYPYDSKYDAYLRGRATLTPAEAHGLSLFEDPGKGNCASCHPSRSKDGAAPAFTDYGYIALGVPRNPAIAANRDPRFYDMGLCGPERTDLRTRTEYCGLFRTPTLRNVALRKSFFHNGAFHTLDRAVTFYAERETSPGKWYARDRRGNVLRYDDLPARFQDNVNRDPPFDRKPGDAPALTPSEVRDIVAFLRTLTDGYGMETGPRPK